MNRRLRPSLRHHRRRQRQGGIALLEALLAILILAIGLLGTIGLQARAYSALSDAGMRAEATIATEKLLGVMANDKANIASYAFDDADGGEADARLQDWLEETRAALPGEATSISVAVEPQSGTSLNVVTVTIHWRRHADGPLNTHQVTAYLAAAS